MNQLILSFLVAVTALFHMIARSSFKKGRVREAFCASWCVDAVFAVCGMLISFGLYHYDFAPFLTLHNLLWGFLFLIVTFLFFLLAPSGFSLLKKAVLQEEILLAEYRFNDTLCMVRNFFLALLFGLPVLLAILQKINLPLSLFLTWSESEICGAFCFTAFLILLPISIRQAFFWLKHLQRTPEAEETRALRQYSIQLHYRQKNRRL